MKYLEEYNLTEEQINDLKNSLEDTDLFEFEVEKVCSILDLFRGIGVNDFYNLIKVGYEMFYDTVKSIKRRIDNYGDSSELARLINEDAYNLVVADLL